jgi:hypothetical protein
MVDTCFLHRLSEEVHILINVLCDVTTTHTNLWQKTKSAEADSDS